jgi:DNA (cytosine-5)-methyltransferase 1
VDIKPQPRYPFEFHQADALEYPLEGFDAYWASPPCQRFSVATRVHHNADLHPDLLTPIRDRLSRVKRPYVIENVVGAPMIEPIMLCGSSFGLRVRRHRLFEANIPLWALPCNHHWQNKNPLWSIRQNYKTLKTGVCYVFGHQKVGQTIEDWKSAMGIDWMTQGELSQAIPPAYSEYIGRQMLKAMGVPVSSNYVEGR